MQKAQDCASILGPPASLGLTGGRACEAESLFSRWRRGPLPCRLPVARHPPVPPDGDGAWGPGCLGLSAPVPRNLEMGRAWGLGVFSTCCWLWGKAQRGAGLRAAGGPQEGLWAAGPSPPQPPHCQSPRPFAENWLRPCDLCLTPAPTQGPSWRRACTFRHRPRRLISCCFLTPSHVRPEPPWPVTQPLSPGQGFTLENDRGEEMHTNIHRIYYF